MALTLYNLFEAILLCVNAIAVLHEERFLAKVGWGKDQANRGFGDEQGIKYQLINLIHSVRTVMRIPLIFFNILTIIFKLILG
ncbi:immediate early response 3-interacting protein 1 [Centruroides vittatus]|uniref:immediate early response 3-interacting protein 1-like n=1 Tax=Centruroides sculpturatus TaxID=218467 RepID=UPI000C6CC42F|nr:immediate early response 3-interacting protein 1-like [Centruroides sculpturatus]XP_023231495.1 immediate early response 3-interacting protein 1-like [Centruroides sculpturatus]